MFHSITYFLLKCLINNGVGVSISFYLTCYTTDWLKQRQTVIMYVPSSSRVHVCVCVTNLQLTFIPVFYFSFDSKYCVLCVMAA